jgi:hypothetical protein
MVRATLKGRRLHAFPWPLAALARAAARLPPGLRAAGMGAFRTTVEPEPPR